MKKATNCSEYLFQKVFGIFIFLTFYILTGLHAQDTGEGIIDKDLNSESEYEISETYTKLCPNLESGFWRELATFQFITLQKPQWGKLGSGTFYIP